MRQTIVTRTWSLCQVHLLLCPWWCSPALSYQAGGHWRAGDRSGAPGTVICIQQGVNMSLLTIIAVDNLYWAHNAYQALWRRTLRGFLLLLLTSPFEIGIWRNIYIAIFVCQNQSDIDNFRWLNLIILSHKNTVEYQQLYMVRSNNLLYLFCQWRSLDTETCSKSSQLAGGRAGIWTSRSDCRPSHWTAAWCCLLLGGKTKADLQGLGVQVGSSTPQPVLRSKKAGQMNQMFPGVSGYAGDAA